MVEVCDLDKTNQRRGFPLLALEYAGNGAPAPGLAGRRPERTTNLEKARPPADTPGLFGAALPLILLGVLR